MVDFIRTYPLQPVDTTWLNYKGDSLGVRPVSQAFTRGTLMMSTQPSSDITAVPKTWKDYPLNSILVCLSILTILLLVKNIFFIFHNLLDCLSRWKGNQDLEENMQLTRVRNLIALAFILPFALVASRYDLYHPQFFNLISGPWITLACIAIMAAYALLRVFLAWQLRPKSSRSDTYKYASRCSYSFFILACIALFIAIGIMNVIGTDDATIKTVSFYILAAFYAIFIVRKHQFLLSGCNPFATFLYLCTLEIIPTGILIATDIIL